MQLASRTDEFQFSFSTKEGGGSDAGFGINEKSVSANLRPIVETACLANIILTSELQSHSDLRRFAKINLLGMAIQQQERDYLAERTFHVLPIFDAITACRAGVMFRRTGREQSIEGISRTLDALLFSATYHPSKEETNFGKFHFFDLAKSHICFSIDYNLETDVLFRIGRQDLPFESAQAIKSILALLAKNGISRPVCLVRSNFKHKDTASHSIKQLLPIKGISRRLNELLMRSGVSSLASIIHLSEDTVLRIPGFGKSSLAALEQALSESNVGFGSALYKLIPALQAEFQNFQSLYYFSDWENER